MLKFWYSIGKVSYLTKQDVASIGALQCSLRVLLKLPMFDQFWRDADYVLRKLFLSKQAIKLRIVATGIPDFLNNCFKWSTQLKYTFNRRSISEKKRCYALGLFNLNKQTFDFFTSIYLN